VILDNQQKEPDTTGIVNNNAANIIGFYIDIIPAKDILIW
jgi:hypothetical protein